MRPLPFTVPNGLPRGSVPKGVGLKEIDMAVYGNAYQWGGYPLPTAPIPRYNGRAWFVDGTNGLDGNSGRSPKNAFASIGAAVDNVDLQEGDVIYVFPKVLAATDTDPGNYAETFTIDTPQIALVGIGAGAMQGAIPQVKIGAGSTAMCTVSAPGVTIQGIGFNGGDSTGGGIILHDDGGSTAAAFGTIIRGCHFKNCKYHATQGTTGGAIYWADHGGAWQILIEGNEFYKNVSDIVLRAGAAVIPQDITIRGNRFSGPAASVTSNIYTGGSGINGLYIYDNIFPCWPALSSGDVNKPVSLTGSVGILSGNRFGTTTAKTFGAGGDAVVPTTMLMAANYYEVAIGDTNYQAGQIGRT